MSASSNSEARPLTLGRALLDALADRGARCLFGIPGDFIIPLFREARRRPPGHTHLPLYGLTHEPAVGFAADGAARQGGGLGVAMVTYGAGALNLVNTVANAWAEKTPLVVISGAPGLAERRRPLLIHHQVKYLDSQAKIMAELTVDHAVLDAPAHAPARIARVLDAALHHSRPVYLELPRDLVDAPCEPVPAPLPLPFDPALARLAAALTHRLLRTAKRPLLLIDVEVRRFDLEPIVARLAADLGLPVVTTLSGRGLLAGTQLVSGTWLGRAGDPEVDALVTHSDLIVALGLIHSDTNLSATYIPNGVHRDTLHFASGRSVLIDACDGRVNFVPHDHPLAAVVGVGDVSYDLPLRPYLEALASLVAHDPISREPAPATIRRAPRHAPPAHDNDAPIDPDAVADAINALFAVHGPMPIVSDVGDCLFTCAAIDDCAILAPAYYATMGYAIPAALGAMAATGERVLVLVGDGAFQMSGLELAAATPHGLDPIVIVFDNRGWEMVKQFDDLSPHHDLPPVDFAAIARALGGRGHTVSSQAGLVAALAEAHAERGHVHVIHVVLEPNTTSSALAAFAAAFSQARDPRWPGSLSAPERRHGHGTHAITEGEDARTGVKYDAMDKALTELFPQPVEVAGVATRYDGARLDLDADDAVTGELDDQVDLLTSTLGAEVIEARATLADRQLGSQLRGDKSVEQTAELLMVAHQRSFIEVGGAGGEPRIDEITLGRLDEPLGAVGEPGRDDVEEEQLSGETLVGIASHA